MKNKSASTLKTIITNKLTPCSKQVMKTSQLSLIECLLDVPEMRLESYVTANNKSFVTDITSDVLNAKRATAKLLGGILGKIN